MNSAVQIVDPLFIGSPMVWVAFVSHVDAEGVNLDIEDFGGTGLACVRLPTRMGLKKLFV